MLKLIQNEWMKLWHQKATWAMLLILIAVIVGFGGINKYYSVKETRDWQTIEKENIASNKQIITENNMNEADAAYFQEQITISEYRLAHDIAPPQDATFASFMDFSVNLMTFVTLFAVIVAAGIVSSEFSTGTIKMLLTRPVSRTKILTSKLLLSFLYGLFMLVVNFAVVAIVGLILFGQGAGVQLELVNGVVQEVDVWGDLFEKAYLSLGNFTISILFAFFIGSVFRSSALAIGLTMFLSYMGTVIVLLLSKYSFAKYIWLAHADLTQYQTGNIMIEGSTMTLSLTVLAVYAVIFLVASYWSFSKRDVTA
ncbi:ABC transporter permease [Lysinibacillus piscis]|uniref:ABC transporter permease n=1 Tax=Lysinibacillus piscis TaxID=2518931 RepID=A0ABQ5NK56_9BACI|nr:ABC transporter permease [Lysinibacillus sp. KH24]GLC88414.1 hypothetical protein LYSBPC_15410 [Lysinibacillus sp. KH24]